MLGRASELLRQAAVPNTLGSNGGGTSCNERQKNWSQLGSLGVGQRAKRRPLIVEFCHLQSSPILSSR